MHDGFVNIQFSDPARGLHGCTPAEVLHAFQMGLAERSIEICFEQRKLLKQKRKGSAQSHQATKKAKLLHEGSSDSEADVHDQPPVSDDDSGNDQFSEEEDEVASEVMAAITSDDTSRLQVFSKEAKREWTCWPENSIGILLGRARKIFREPLSPMASPNSQRCKATRELECSCSH